jgi:hypothetical protein
MSSSFPAATLIVVLCMYAGAQQPADKATKAREIKPKRGECAILLPAHDERRDLARLVRSDQYLDCERDGFPKHLAPPWKEQEEAEKKLSAACDYFIAKAVKDYPQVGRANLQLVADRCRINVLTVILGQLVESTPTSTTPP